MQDSHTATRILIAAAEALDAILQVGDIEDLDAEKMVTAAAAAEPLEVMTQVFDMKGNLQGTQKTAFATPSEPLAVVKLQVEPSCVTV